MEYLTLVFVLAYLAIQVLVLRCFVALILFH